MTKLGLSRSVCSILLVFVLVGLSSSAFIADDVFGSHAAAAGRSLLQAKKDCRVDFTLLNFSIITIQCRGSKFEAASCCKAFKDFACPYANAINDPKTGCAAALFDYSRNMGNYPPRVFKAQCREGNKVVSCPP